MTETTLAPGYWPTGADFGKLRSAARACAKAGIGYLPRGLYRADIIAPDGLIGDAPVLGFGPEPVATMVVSRSQPTMAELRAENKQLRQLLEGTIAHLRTENARLRGGVA